MRAERQLPWGVMRRGVNVGVRYLEVVLGLRRLAPGLVPAYVGPPALARRIDESAPLAAVELREHARELREVVEHGEPDAARRRWLSAQLGALETALGWLSGESFGYRELVERCHGVQPTVVPEEQFADAHRLLDASLPGGGDVRRRYQEWSLPQLVAPQLVLPGIEALASELQRRTEEHSACRVARASH